MAQQFGYDQRARQIGVRQYQGERFATVSLARRPRLPLPARY
jgi:hypothetical protein